ncbi:BRO family protein [Salininema proteolyticum]|uniref:BRO family protein n=1 Tax=Salininema proteolyticum TaxID=1607685 RepID=A0ABV8TTE4_9ACTN
MATTDIHTYRYPITGDAVRTIDIDGQPWFVGRDVATALGYRNPNRSLTDHVPAGHRKGTESVPLHNLGLHPQTVLIDEAGMYRLIMRARTEIAETFQEWVTADVLPTLRRTGHYSTGDHVPRTLPEALRAYATEVEAHDATRTALAAAEPKAEDWDVLASAHGDYSVADAAKVLSQDPLIEIGQRRLFAVLDRVGWIYRGSDGEWRAYQSAIKAGHVGEAPSWYSHPRTFERVTTVRVVITMTGVARLRRLLTPQPAIDGVRAE